MSKCTAKHTAYQPKDSEWKCPDCGEDDYYFYIDKSASNADGSCELLHSGDWVVCNNCEGGWSGTAVAKKMQAKDNTVVLEVVMEEKRKFAKDELDAIKNILSARSVKQK